MAQILIPSPLRKFTGAEAKIEVRGDKNILQSLQELANEYEDLRPHLFDGQGEIRPYLRIFLADTDIEDLSGKDTMIKENDVISIIPAIAGGSK